MAAPTVYRSTDPSAPVLTGQAGSLTAVLDACLVNGYGAKAALGWTKPFTAAGSASFRAPAGIQFYLQCSDNGPGAGSFREARMTIWDTQSGYNAGGAKAPIETTAASIYAVRKSATLDATAREWLLIGDAKGILLFVKTGDVVAAAWQAGFHAGEFAAFRTAGDPFRAMIVGRDIENAAVMTSERIGALSAGGFAGSATPGHVFLKTSTGATPAAAVNAWTIHGLVTTLAAAFAGFNAYDQAVYLLPIYLGDTSNHPRGVMRGVYGLAQSGTGLVDGDTFTGSGEFAGRTFLYVGVYGAGTQTAIIVQTSDWDA